MDGCQLGALLVLRNEAGQYLGGNLTLGTQYRQLFGDALQLADIARPLVAHQHVLGLVGQHHLVHAVFLGHLHGEESEQQHDVLAALAQGRHLDLHLVQTIVEVFAETAFADGLADIDIGSCHHAYIGLAHLGGSDGDVLAILQHTQQAGLGGDGQLAYLVEEQGALVGGSEVTQRIVDGSRKRAFHMAE